MFAVLIYALNCLLPFLMNKDVYTFIKNCYST